MKNPYLLLVNVRVLSKLICEILTCKDDSAWKWGILEVLSS